MVKKAAQLKSKEGDVILIKLPDNTFGYGRVLIDTLFAFYDLKTSEPLLDIDSIIERSVLFKVWVMKHVIRSGRWVFIWESTC